MLQSQAQNHAAQHPTSHSVVVADDHRILLESVSDLLNMTEDIVVVGQATTGEEAVAVVQDVRPNIAILDLDMPVLNGIEAARRIAEKVPTCRILILTSNNNRQELNNVLQVGAAGYLLKSSATAQLILAIRSINAGGSVIDINMMREFTRQRTISSQLDSLTDRERAILPLIARGYSNAAIAEQMFIAEVTVRSNISRTLSKLNLQNRVQLATLALRENLITLDETAP